MTRSGLDEGTKLSSVPPELAASMLGFQRKIIVVNIEKAKLSFGLCPQQRPAKARLMKMADHPILTS
jgi:hypothetical protein